MKKIFLLCFLAVISLYSLTASAFEYPSSFWSVNSKYEQAIKSNNHYDAIRYGNEIINMMLNLPDCREKTDTLVTRYNQIGISYAATGDYEKSKQAFQYMCSHAEADYGKYSEYIKGAKARIEQYTPEIKLYTDKGTPIYFGAVNEKRNGVLFGMCSNGKTRNKLDNESLVLTYQELGQTLLSHNSSIVRSAANSGLAVEFALNCPNEGTDIGNIDRMDSYLKEISDLFRQYSGVPIYLRFAAEFDVWENQANAEEFKYAFRHVSKYFKSRNSNVAVVWSPNYVSNWDINVDDFYPGDEYVDWVGMSLYSQPYFKGDKNREEIEQIYFKTGRNSNPVIAARKLVEKYGNRKPIMISESGSSHRVVKTGEDATQFGLKRLKEQYNYLFMMYPQIKAIAYFDWFVNSGKETDDFRLSESSTLQNEYLKLIKGARFIQDSYGNDTDYCNRRIYSGIDLDGIFEVSCYAHMYDTSVKNVVYYIDGNYAGVANDIPYTTLIDASDYSGRHILKAVATFANGKKLEYESVVNISNNRKNITVEISDKKINFDQDPIIYNDRTMVPMRKIFEELGASVSWDSTTKTVSGRKGDRTVKVTVGQKVMSVNNKKITLDTSPMILSDRTLVPVRAVAEGLGCDVDWDGRNYIVSVTPKIFRWSEWDDDLPDFVDSDMYYIEESEEYRMRTREKDYFTLDYEFRSSNFVREEVSYGSWSDWQNDYISESNRLEVETRTEYEPKRYHYLHYCTGYISDADNRYRTSSGWWHDECVFHDLGWFDYELPYSEDSTSDYAYFVDGKRYRCPNTCYRWYLAETTGGNYTQYRSREIYREYVYWEWGDWSRWSDWGEDDPYDYYDTDDDEDIDVEERVIYRYKEKG